MNKSCKCRSTTELTESTETPLISEDVSVLSVFSVVNLRLECARKRTPEGQSGVQWVTPVTWGCQGCVSAAWLGRSVDTLLGIFGVRSM